MDRETVTELGTKVDPSRQEIRVDGERLPSPRRVVIMLNKPVGVVTTNYDPSGRPRVIDLVPSRERLFAVGRLDRSSEGLILLTNDGELANRLAHPRYGVEKTYLVQVAGLPSEETLDQLRRGIRLAEGRAQARRVAVRSRHKHSAVVELVLDEGKNREIRRMLAACGHKVQQLKRIAIGPLSLGTLLPGESRPLSWGEIRSLEQAGGPATDRRQQERPRSRGTPGRKRPAGGAPPRRRRPGRASSWRKPRPAG